MVTLRRLGTDPQTGDLTSIRADFDGGNYLRVKFFSRAANAQPTVLSLQLKPDVVEVVAPSGTILQVSVSHSWGGVFLMQVEVEGVRLVPVFTVSSIEIEGCELVQVHGPMRMVLAVYKNRAPIQGPDDLEAMEKKHPLDVMAECRLLGTITVDVAVKG